ncbi:hypothetical protein CTRI78_v010111 [Colletotrichum trifolii]|uniref:Uncharacterized protein n=1 Tax=Colletotrichum trifolii TaxID=5466 RepID=A0A4V3HTU3_COLTR|nr:hypothetical protein CTRI78_v010111 [Colletotrichum trifolii]
MLVSTAFFTILLTLTAGVSAVPKPQLFQGNPNDFGTYFCQTRSADGKSGKQVPSDNFCKAAGGAVLASPGFCCIRNNDAKVVGALQNGCRDNSLVLSQNSVKCSP